MTMRSALEDAARDPAELRSSRPVGGTDATANGLGYALSCGGDGSLAAAYRPEE